MLIPGSFSKICILRGTHLDSENQIFMFYIKNSDLLLILKVFCLLVVILSDFGTQILLLFVMYG